MNRLSTSERACFTAALVEGNSLRSTSRMCGVAFNTVLKLVPQIGIACADYHDAYVRNIRAKRIPCDEIWQFVGCKAKNATPEKKAAGCGDVWTWTAIDADTKLCISYMVGGRDGGWAYDFMQDVASRVIGRPQITTDGHKPYLEAVETAFGADVDFATLQKIYGASEEPAKRYSPAKCIGVECKVINGDPDPKHTSTSYALHFMHYNFCRVHKTLRVTPAMEAALSDHVWSLEELSSLLDAPVSAIA